MFLNLVDSIFRLISTHRATIIDYKTEMLLSLLIVSAFFEKLRALQKLYVQGNLVLVIDLVFQSSQKFVALTVHRIFDSWYSLGTLRTR